MTKIQKTLLGIAILIVLAATYWLSQAQYDYYDPYSNSNIDYFPMNPVDTSGSGSSSGSSSSSSTSTSTPSATTTTTSGGSVNIPAQYLPTGTRGVYTKAGNYGSKSKISYADTGAEIPNVIGVYGNLIYYVVESPYSRTEIGKYIKELNVDYSKNIFGYIYPDKLSAAISAAAAGTTNTSTTTTTSATTTSTGSYCDSVPSYGRQVSVDKTTYAVRYYDTQELIPDVVGMSGASSLYMKNSSGAGDYNYIIGTICGTIQENKFSFIYKDKLEQFRGMIAKAAATDPRNIPDSTSFTVPADKTEIVVESGGVYNAKTKEAIPDARYDAIAHAIYYKDTQSGFGTMMTKTRGYVNIKPGITPSEAAATTDQMEQTTAEAPATPNQPEVSEETEDAEVTTTDQTPSAPPAGYEEEVITEEENPFSDTELVTLEGQAAAALYEQAIIGGYPDGEFKGWKPVNRAEAAKFLILARYGKSETVDYTAKFSDVPEGQWYTNYVLMAAAKGIINGYPDGAFRPGNTVNTAEFLKMLSLTFNLEKNLRYSYTDVPSGEWFAAYAGVAEKYKLFPEKKKRKLTPAQSLTRKEVAIAIYQYLSQD